jgi:hypothetical protein
MRYIDTLCSDCGEEFIEGDNVYWAIYQSETDEWTEYTHRDCSFSNEESTKTLSGMYIQDKDPNKP